MFCKFLLVVNKDDVDSSPVRWGMVEEGRECLSFGGGRCSFKPKGSTGTAYAKCGIRSTSVEGSKRQIFAKAA